MKSLEKFWVSVYKFRFVVVFSKQFYSVFLFSVKIITTAVFPFLLGQDDIIFRSLSSLLEIPQSVNHYGEDIEQFKL